MADAPNDLRYTDRDLWVRPGDTLVTVGITQVAADRLGAIGFAELPYPGELFKSGERVGSLSGQAGSVTLLMPFLGQINAVNQALSDAPGVINSDPYGDGWILRVEPGDPAEVEALMDAAEYVAFSSSQDG
ncbi:MAG TPA: glycine cleavage system protein H [Solirubrobacteraceae bacterium]|nr:glycine cleavage system protein H [Solirubrobacteraceae bacterium]